MSSTDRRRQALQPKKNRGSAGRSNGQRVGVPVEKLETIGLEQFCRACDRMLAEHVPGYRVFNFSGRDVTAEIIGKAPPKQTRREEAPVLRVFWKSKELRAGGC